MASEQSRVRALVEFRGIWGKVDGEECGIDGRRKMQLNGGESNIAVGGCSVEDEWWKEELSSSIDCLLENTITQ